MNGRYSTFLQWQWTHNTVASDVIRIFLGIALLVRGFLFVAEPSRLAHIVEASGLEWFAQYITWAHLIGGGMMTVGLFTRIATLIQIPVLLGAVSLVHLREGLFASSQSLELSALVLFLLAVILVFGPGRVSFDYFFWGKRFEV